MSKHTQESEIQPGDIVRFKTGGRTRMIVSSIGDHYDTDIAVCYRLRWWSGEPSRYYDEWPVTVLAKVVQP